MNTIQKSQGKREGDTKFHLRAAPSPLAGVVRPAAAVLLTLVAVAVVLL